MIHLLNVRLYFEQKQSCLLMREHLKLAKDFKEKQ